MRRLNWVWVIMLAFFCFSRGVFAGEMGLGETLVRQLWEDMKEGNITRIEDYIAPGFQSVHWDGSRDRNEEIQLIKNLDLG
ncbi:hypothetical protein J7M02_04835, partial [Candidatus Aerophobetes bacterium]|nr:hypothetical protein [Candidatus Aerophobetes bacterium]